MKTKILLLVLFFLATQVADAQIMFQRRYGGISDDYGCKVLQTGEGGYLVAAITKSYGSGGWDIYLIKTNEYGDTLWTKTYGGAGDEQPNALKKTADGNYIIVGRTTSFGNGYDDAYLLKINQAGNTLWTKTYGGSQDENAYDVIQTADNGFLLIGLTSSYTHGYNSVYAIKTNSIGDTLWTKTYEKEYRNSGISAIQLSDGGFFFCGETDNSSPTSQDCYFIRTNSQGDTLWTKTFGGNNYDGAYNCYDAVDGIIISGTTRSYGEGGYDIFLSKFDYNGNNIWIKTYGGQLDDYGGSFDPTNDGGYILTGYTQSFGAGFRDMYLIKTNNIGDTSWTKTFGGSGDEWGGCVKQTLDNGYVIVGNTNSFGNQNEYDVFIVKTNFEGVSGFQRIIRTDQQCNVFPNPSKGIINIQLYKVHLDFSVHVYDLTGRIVYSKISLFNTLNTGQLDLSDVSNGSYILLLSNKETKIIKKIIIQK